MTAADDRAALEKVLTTLDVFLSNQRMAWVVEDFHNHETLLSTLRHVLAIPAPAMAPIVHTIHGARGILELTAHEFGVYREAIVDAMAEARREAIEAAAAECERYAAECSKSEAENPGEGWRDEAIGARRAREAVLALAAEPAARGKIERCQWRSDDGRGPQCEKALGHGDCHSYTRPVPTIESDDETPPAPLDDAAALERAIKISERESILTDDMHELLQENADRLRQPPAPAPEPDVFEAFGVDCTRRWTQACERHEEGRTGTERIGDNARAWFGPLVKALVRIYNDGASRYDAQIVLDTLAQLRARAKEEEST